MLMLGVTGGDKQMEGEVGNHAGVSSHLQAVVDYYGPSDFVMLLLGVAASSKLKLAEQASPAFHVDKNSTPGTPASEFRSACLLAALFARGFLDKNRCCR